MRKVAWGALLYRLGREVPGFSLPWSLPHKKFVAPLPQSFHPAFYRTERLSRYNQESTHNQTPSLLPHEPSSDEFFPQFVYMYSYLLSPLKKNHIPPENPTIPSNYEIAFRPPLTNPTSVSILLTYHFFRLVFANIPRILKPLKYKLWRS